VDVVEQIAIDRAKELFGLNMPMCSHILVLRLIQLFSFCLKPGDKILGFDLSHGGHLTHGSPVNFQDVCTPSSTVLSVKRDV
jgi:glycine hydroxymethyltransferase